MTFLYNFTYLDFCIYYDTFSSFNFYTGCPELSRRIPDSVIQKASYPLDKKIFGSNVVEQKSMYLT